MGFITMKNQHLGQHFWNFCPSIFIANPSFRKGNLKNLCNFGLLSLLTSFVFAEENEVTKTWKTSLSLVFCAILLTHFCTSEKILFLNSLGP